MNTDAAVLVTDDGPVRTLTLNRPHRRNALDARLVDALDAALTAAETDDHIRVLILAGRGKSFCAGADLQYFLELHQQQDTPIAFLRRVSALITRFETSALPVVAALHGHAVAGGLELALGCDIVIAADDTLIGDGHVRNNLLPAGGSSVRLPRKVGESMARWLCLTGDLVRPTSLTATGWIHTVVPAHNVQATALRVAQHLAERSGPAQSNLKKLLFDLTYLHSTDGLAHEVDTFEHHWATNDVPSDLSAFLNRKALTDNTQGTP